ncbi:Rhodanese-like domain-containing protein [Mucidula mucida]|nr:Rhodanese-like domain-containing protein [Mucidula mucida]
MTSEAPWHAGFPTATSSAGRISPEDLHTRLGAGDKDILVVDLRRTDFEIVVDPSIDGFIKGAINLPAHTFYPTLPGLVPILSQFKEVVFHCQSCSATSRAARASSWFQDALNEQGIPADKCKPLVLDGGIKGWLKIYKDNSLTCPL